MICTVLTIKMTFLDFVLFSSVSEKKKERNCQVTISSSFFFVFFGGGMIDSIYPQTTGILQPNVTLQKSYNLHLVVQFYSINKV